MGRILPEKRPCKSVSSRPFLVIFALKLFETDNSGQERFMFELDRITQDPQIMGGKACIRGMRVTVGMIVGQIGAGHSVDEILADYPYLEREDILQALRYAAWRAEERRSRPAQHHQDKHERQIDNGRKKQAARYGVGLANRKLCSVIQEGNAEERRSRCVEETVDPQEQWGEA